jgi:uncharacterized protein YkwD
LGVLALALLLAIDPMEGFNPAEAERFFFQETNEARAGEGLDSLAYDSLLSEAARGHSEEMARLGYQSHTSPVEENRTLEKRLVNAGVDTANCVAGENICKMWGNRYLLEDFSFDYQALAKGALKELMASPGHRNNVLLVDFTSLGVGAAIGQDGEDLWIYFTQVFRGE